MESLKLFYEIIQQNPWTTFFLAMFILSCCYALGGNKEQDK